MYRDLPVGIDSYDYTLYLRNDLIPSTTRSDIEYEQEARARTGDGEWDHAGVARTPTARAWTGVIRLPDATADDVFTPDVLDRVFSPRIPPVADGRLDHHAVGGSGSAPPAPRRLGTRRERSGASL